MEKCRLSVLHCRQSHQFEYVQFNWSLTQITRLHAALVCVHDPDKCSNSVLKKIRMNIVITDSNNDDNWASLHLFIIRSEQQEENRENTQKMECILHCDGVFRRATNEMQSHSGG